MDLLTEGEDGEYTYERDVSIGYPRLEEFCIAIGRAAIIAVYQTSHSLIMSGKGGNSGRSIISRTIGLRFEMKIMRLPQLLQF
jgi:hypothetical protein